MRSITIHLVIRHRHRVRTFIDRAFCHMSTIFDSKGKSRMGTRLKHHFTAGRRTQTFLRDYTRTRFAVRSVAAHPLHGSPTTPFAASALRRRTTQGLKCAITRAVVVTRHLCRRNLVACVHASSMGLSRLTLSSDQRIVASVVKSGCMGAQRFTAGAGNTRRTRRTVHPACVAGRAVRNASRRRHLCRLV